MLIEIAICTWNRAASLRRTLDSLHKIDVPRNHSIRILIVDNGSTDETPEVIAEYAKTLPIDALVEPEPGHTRARNRAISASCGDVVLWTDDDVVVDRGWVQAYVNAGKRDPNAVFWGGVIEPVYLVDPPRWVKENESSLSGCFAARDLGPEPVELTFDRLPYGANFAIRGPVQRTFPFNVELGRKRERVLGEDELDLFRRLLGNGYKGMWVPEAKVQHLIPADRLTEKYVMQYFVGQGRILAKANRRWSDLRRELIWHRLLYWLTRPWAKSPAWFAHMARWGLAKGQLTELSDV